MVHDREFRVPGFDERLRREGRLGVEVKMLSLGVLGVLWPKTENAIRENGSCRYV